MTDTGGDPSCWLGEVCPECGAVPDVEAGHGCAACAPAVRLAEVVATGAVVAATRSRTAKTDALASLLRQTVADDLPVVIGLLVGEPRQGRFGVGWASALSIDAQPATSASLTVREVDATISALASTSGAGSAAVRSMLLHDLFVRATVDEADYLRRLIVGELRPGALGSVVTDALAKALAIPPTVVRRAAMLMGDLGEAAVIARNGGEAALRTVGLRVGRAVQPMLASPAADIGAALEGITSAVVEWKLDGIRIQVHKLGDDVRVFTRNLNDITDRVPEVVAAARSLDAHALVLDGEAMAWVDGSAPVPFQDTMSRVGRGEEQSWQHALRPYFFDCVHRDGVDLLDEPLHVRRAALAAVAPAHRIPGEETTDSAHGQRVADASLDAGHEGVVVKDLDSLYLAGRRGSSWRKVKPVRAYDLVVLAVEWGHGRRTGWLSNLHLGARDPDGGFVMVGKTFKGLTDALLTWQTTRFLELEERRTASTVFVRPEVMVEIAIDGVQESRRYPGGVALRFARVKRYREDKDASDADLIGSLQALLPQR
jgi:DNA ligase-1